MPADTLSHRGYVLVVLLAALLLLMGVAARNYVIDPYRLYPSVPGFAETDPVDLFFHLRLHKPHAISERRPDHLILGSSRSARLPPALLADGASTYNAALPGVTLRELRLLMEHAQANHQLQSVVLGLDYYMFRPGYSELTAHFEESRMLKLHPTLRQRLSALFRRLQDYWVSLLAFDALVEGWATAGADTGSNRVYQEDGTWGAGEKVQANRIRPYAMVARQMYREFAGQDHRRDLSELKQLLELAREEKIDLSLLISPLHGSAMTAVQQAGAWEDYLAWQESIVKLAATSYPAAKVYGFEDNPSFVHEPLEQQDPLFRDAAHYTRKASAAMMNCLQQRCGPQLKMRELTPRTVDDYLQDVSSLMKDYAEAAPADYARVLDWIERERSS